METSGSAFDPTILIAIVVVIGSLLFWHHVLDKVDGVPNSDLPFEVRTRSVKFFRRYSFPAPMKILGQGAFSKVLQGCSRGKPHEKFAVKCLNRAQVQQDADGYADLVREKEILMEVDHPGVIRCYDFIEDGANSMYWMVLEAVDGGELFDRIQEKTTYNEHDARSTCLVILDILAYLHDRGIAHRDLKPENLLLKSSGSDSEVKLCDFGFAAKTNGEDLDQKCGTADYVAPEIVKGIKYGVPVDMWSAGVILFILLGGYPPFPDSEKDSFKAISSGTFEFHQRWWGAVSDEAKDLIQKLLTVDSSKRLTARQAMRHPWFMEEESVLVDNNLEKGLEQFKKWNARRKLRGTIKTVMAASLMSKMKRRNSTKI